MAKDYEGKRNKRKDKYKEKKKHPYKSGGKFRSYENAREYGKKEKKN